MDPQEVRKVLERVEEARSEARRWALRFSDRYDRFTEESRARYEDRVRYAQHLRSQRLNNSVASFERATANLERHQLNRLNRVVEDYDLARNYEALSLWGRFLTFISIRRWNTPFEEHLRRAHEHPAVTRKDGGVRSWYEEWLSYALLVIEHGLAPDRFAAIVRTKSSLKRRRGAIRPPRYCQLVHHRFRERLLHVVEPHGPTVGPFRRCRTSEAGLAA